MVLGARTDSSHVQCYHRCGWTNDDSARLSTSDASYELVARQGVLRWSEWDVKDEVVVGRVVCSR